MTCLHQEKRNPSLEGIRTVKIVAVPEKKDIPNRHSRLFRRQCMQTYLYSLTSSAYFSEYSIREALMVGLCRRRGFLFFVFLFTVLLKTVRPARRVDVTAAQGWSLLGRRSSRGQKASTFPLLSSAQSRDTTLPRQSESH